VIEPPPPPADADARMLDVDDEARTVVKDVAVKDNAEAAKHRAKKRAVVSVADALDEFVAAADAQPPRRRHALLPPERMLQYAAAAGSLSSVISKLQRDGELTPSRQAVLDWRRVLADSTAPRERCRLLAPTPFLPRPRRQAKEYAIAAFEKKRSNDAHLD
jgi:hypothetical protein